MPVVGSDDDGVELVDDGEELGEGCAAAVWAGVVNCPLDVDWKVPDGTGPGTRGGGTGDASRPAAGDGPRSTWIGMVQVIRPSDNPGPGP